MALTKQHFQTFAEIVSRFTKPGSEERRQMLLYFVPMCSAENPRFRTDLFLAAIEKLDEINHGDE